MPQVLWTAGGLVDVHLEKGRLCVTLWLALLGYDGASPFTCGAGAATFSGYADQELLSDFLHYPVLHGAVLFSTVQQMLVERPKAGAR